MLGNALEEMSAMALIAARFSARAMDRTGSGRRQTWKSLTNLLNGDSCGGK